MKRLVSICLLASLGFPGCVEEPIIPNAFTSPDAGQPDATDTGPDADATSTPDAADATPIPDADANPRPDVEADVEPVPNEWEQGAWIVGTSVQNRPLVVEQYGTAGPILFLLAAIHGNERSAVTFGEQIRAVLQGGLAERAGIRVVFLGAANPDGIQIGKRHNANDIDLNRNFPTDNFGDGAGAGGTVPLSEPESRAIKAVLDNADASAVISVHCCIPTMDYDGPGEALAQAMTSTMSADIRFPVRPLGALPGSLGSYVGLELNRPIVTLEFALDEQIDILDQLTEVERAIEAGVDWVARNGHAPADAGVSVLAQTGAALDSFILAESAGGLPIRVDTLVQGAGSPVLLLSGLVDNDRRALNVAEHIRRELLANVRDVPLILLTAPNPDGIVSATTTNAAGTEVASDFVAGRLQSPEAEALDALFESLDPRLVVHVEAAAADAVTTLSFDAATVEDAVPPDLAVLGRAEGPLADWLAAHDLALLNLGIQNDWVRGDNQRDDYFDEDPAIFSLLVRRLIKPGLVCGADGYCDDLCLADPDCECDCDHNEFCEAAAPNSSNTCACDPDCSGGLQACRLDAHCDSWCPDDVDPDCPCSCDFNEFCEAAARGTTDTCLCDLDCQGGLVACSADDHCDTWCTEGADPDC